MSEHSEDSRLQIPDASPIAPAAYIQDCNGLGALPVTVEQARLEFRQCREAGRLLTGTFPGGFSWRGPVVGRVFSARPVTGQELAEWHLVLAPGVAEGPQ